MIPRIVVSQSDKKVEEYISQIIAEYGVKAHDIVRLYPQGKEVSISQIRELKKDITYAFKDIHLYVLYQFDMASLEAQNAFLKTLEEHQPTLFFVLVVTNLNRLLPTITSRCTVVYVNKNKHNTSDSTTREIENFIKTGNMKILEKFTFDKKQEDFYKTIDALLSFFRTRLAIDDKTPRILDEIMVARKVVESNNVNAQTSIDHIFLYIKHLYHL